MENEIAELNSKNSKIVVKSYLNADFKAYGSIVKGFDFEQLDDYMNRLEMPVGEVVYYPAIAEMEDKEVLDQVQSHFYGGQKAQIGYCAGDNSSLNGLEYHKGCEILYAFTNLVVLLGHIWDIENGNYSSAKLEAFYVSKGSAVELYGTTLHFAPCKVEKDGFKAVIILPEGTNCDLDIPEKKVTEEDNYLFANNKWLIAHPEAGGLVNDGVYIGITGENLKLNI